MSEATYAGFKDDYVEAVPKVTNPYQRSMDLETIDDSAMVISGPASFALGAKVAGYLGRKVADVEYKKFADGETIFDIKDCVKGKKVYIVHSTSRPVNDSVMQLFLMVSAAKRAGASTITCVIPYYGYARQERKN